jgi:hypothetical protein
MQHAHLLDDRECRRVVAGVDALNERWERRRTAPFFTLGAAAYLDGGEDEAAKDGYHARRAP